MKLFWNFIFYIEEYFSVIFCNHICCHFEYILVSNFVTIVQKMNFCFNCVFCFYVNVEDELLKITTVEPQIIPVKKHSDKSSKTFLYFFEVLWNSCFGTLCFGTLCFGTLCFGTVVLELFVLELFMMFLISLPYFLWIWFIVINICNHCRYIINIFHRLFVIF